jgi:Predicted periplasmic lipoprotein (DUF2279)
MKCKSCFILIILFLCYYQSRAQVADSCGCRNRVPLVTTFMGVSSYMILQQAWYSQYPQTHFHFFNDNREWLQMDKVGHAFTNYQISRNVFNAYMNTGYDRKKASRYAAITSLSYMTGIEMLDGFSKQWGFSYGDFGANFLGTSMFFLQENFFQKQFVQLKFSYRNSPYSKYNSAQLGDNFQQRVLKDYNGQTYWLSFNTNHIFNVYNGFSNVFGFSFGYGVEQMVSAKTNNSLVNNFHPQRKFLFSFDADLKQVKWKRSWMKKLAEYLSIIKIPMPTLEVKGNGKIKLHPIYF